MGGGDIIKKRKISFAFKESRISLTYKLVPVQHREYKYGLLVFQITSLLWWLYCAYEITLLSKTIGFRFPSMKTCGLRHAHDKASLLQPRTQSLRSP